MHKIKIFINCPESFQTTINELKPYLKFKLSSNINDLNNHDRNNFDGYICHEKHLENKVNKDFIDFASCFKVLISSKVNKIIKSFDYNIKLPTTIKEINSVIENGFAKKQFSKNSSIKIKSYILDKNEKKLSRGNNFIILTEKEIQLLELFLKNKKAISKNDILSLVWQYSVDADTHTVETHIYRLRKKINDKFSDNKFILNNKNGYYF